MNLFSCISVVILAGALQAETGWKAGVASVVITPKEPIMLGGYAERVTPSTGVLMDLKAKSLALQDSTGATTLIVTMDLLGVNKDVAEAVAAAVRKQYGIPRARLLFNASHTHSGPIVALKGIRAQQENMTEEQ